jgi:hypothetical protein
MKEISGALIALNGIENPQEVVSFSAFLNNYG